MFSPKESGEKSQYHRPTPFITLLSATRFYQRLSRGISSPKISHTLYPGDSRLKYANKRPTQAPLRAARSRFPNSVESSPLEARLSGEKKERIANNIAPLSTPAISAKNHLLTTTFLFLFQVSGSCFSLSPIPDNVGSGMPLLVGAFPRYCFHRGRCSRRNNSEGRKGFWGGSRGVIKRVGDGEWPWRGQGGKLGRQETSRRRNRVQVPRTSGFFPRKRGREVGEQHVAVYPDVLARGCARSGKSRRRRGL